MRINDYGPEYGTIGHCEHPGVVGCLLTPRLKPEKVRSITTAGVTISPSLVSELVARAAKRSLPLAKSIT